ncbi:NAD(P)/FAD-dependent oxidoreductase [Gordonia humi]|uniref:NADH dehydrogenase FAD-containing subunit n=1 Tax=Gordonia humi TaxID=686429 RepID=A0A840F6D7_9ACTN|nr:FAD-dependent oxidoreductase [Gordonia humi]MBB4135790.1 NADH dehydrogenase FAD-containing subunit [Gordonia humi]
MKIVVAGAGYAGTTAANRLARKIDEAQITVVNPSPDFVERVRLHEMIAGSGSATRPLREMLHERIDLVVASIEEIGDGVVTLSTGQDLAFDRLVYAVGSSNEAPQGTYALGGADQAARAHEKLTELGAGATVTVVGGGLTGLEAVSEVATVRPDLSVCIVSEEFGASLSDGARGRVLDVLRSLGVEIVTGRWTPDDDADLVLWAIAGGVHELTATSPLAVDAAGRVAVDEFLRSTSHPNVYAVGDGAAVPGARLSCQAAIPQAAAAADNLVREAKGEAGKPFSMSFVGQNVSLGRANGVIQASHRNDEPTRFWFGGRPAALFKEQVCRATVRWARSGTAVALPGPR